MASSVANLQAFENRAEPGSGFWPERRRVFRYEASGRNRSERPRRDRIEVPPQRQGGRVEALPIFVFDPNDVEAVIRYFQSIQFEGH
jgi:hypothetical protein